MIHLVYVLGYAVVVLIGLAVIVRFHIEKKQPYEMTLVDFLYILGYLVLLLVGVFTFYYGGKEPMVSYIGFAATLSSLLLSAAAIIYAFYQTRTSSVQTEKLNETSEKLTKTATDLGGTSSKFEEVVNDFRRAQLALATAVDTIGAIRSDVAEVNERIKGAEIFAQKSGSSSVSNQEHLTEADVKRGLNSSPAAGLLSLYLALKCANSDTTRSLNDLTDEIDSKLRQADRSPMTFLFTQGYLSGLRFAGLLNYDLDKFRPTILFESNDSLKALVTDIIERRKTLSKNEKWIVTCQETIDDLQL